MISDGKYAIEAITECLKAQGLLGCMLEEVNAVRMNLGLRPVDKDGDEIGQSEGLGARAQ